MVQATTAKKAILASVCFMSQPTNSSNLWVIQSYCQQYRQVAGAVAEGLKRQSLARYRR
jgi:hypothetical protein